MRGEHCVRVLILCLLRPGCSLLHCLQTRWGPDTRSSLFLCIPSGPAVLQWGTAFARSHPQGEQSPTWDQQTDACCHHLLCEHRQFSSGVRVRTSMLTSEACVTGISFG